MTQPPYLIWVSTQGSNAGAQLDSVKAAIIREGDVGVGDEFAAGNDVIVVVVREEREKFRRGRPTSRLRA